MDVVWIEQDELDIVDGCMQTAGSNVVPSDNNQHPYGIVNDNMT